VGPSNRECEIRVSQIKRATFQGGKMRISKRAVRGNVLSRVVFGLAAVLLTFVPPTVRRGAAAEFYDFQICGGYFALCAASTCTPTGKQITVKTATGGTATFPEADCTCPDILGQSIANLAGATCKVLASRQNRAKSGRLISPDRTFRRHPPTGSRPCQRPQQRRFFARSTSVAEINWLTASASSAIRRLISIMSQ
jgi:hypothetical protein